MTKYIFAKRTLHLFQRESGPFDKEVIDQLDTRYITEGRAIPVDEPKSVVESKPEEKELTPELKQRVEDFKEDLRDDGKRNYSAKTKKSSKRKK